MKLFLFTLFLKKENNDVDNETQRVAFQPSFQIENKLLSSDFKFKISMSRSFGEFLCV